jgi:hypothetical protein
MFTGSAIGKVMENFKKRASFAFVSCLLLLASCSGDRLYYANKQKPVDDITKTFGEPLAVRVWPTDLKKSCNLFMILWVRGIM